MVKNSLTLKALKTMTRGNLGPEDTEEDMQDLTQRQREMEANEIVESEFDPGAKDQDMNKKTFVNKYGVKIDLPSFYTLDAKIYPVDINYCIKVVKHSIPDAAQVVKSYGVDEEPNDTTIGELFEDAQYQKQNVVLQLIKICSDQTMMIVK